MTKRIGLGVVLGLFLLGVLDAVLGRLGFSSSIVPKLEGIALWTTSRAAGVTALLALTLDVVFGLFVSTGAADRLITRGQSVEIHRSLSSIALGLVALHAFALIGDRFIHFDALDVLVPFLAPYRPFAVGLGVLAAEGALVVYASFWLRRHIGAKAWRKLHYLSFAAFVAAVAHGLAAGSDARTPVMVAFYAVSSMLVASLVVSRGRWSKRPHAAQRRGTR